MSPRVETEALEPIRPLDLAREQESLGTAVEEAVCAVLRSGQYVLGPEVERLEASFAELCGVPHAVACSSGTEALVLALLAAGVEPGDEVVTSPFTFFASAGAIAWIGARPRFCDVELETGLMDVSLLPQAITGNTRCLLPVHLYGQMADVARLRGIAEEHELRWIEDAAQAHGAERAGTRCGELSDAAAFSFYPTKNLGTAGEGGLVVTRRQDVAEALRCLRDHGSVAKYRHARVGTNGRLSALQAAVLNVKLPRLETWNARRREIAERYDEELAGLTTVLPMRPLPGACHAYHQYTVRVVAPLERDALRQGLEARGIHAAVHYPIPVHLQEAARPFGYGPGDFPVAERLASEVLCLPVHPFLRDDEVLRVARAVRELAAPA